MFIFETSSLSVSFRLASFWADLSGACELGAWLCFHSSLDSIQPEVEECPFFDGTPALKKISMRII